MDQLTALITTLNSYLWGNFCLVPLLCGAGLYFTLRLRFVQVRKFGLAVKYTFGQLSFSGAKAGKDGMSSFQALATAVAAQVGTGNVVGVATALTMGGPGALFWIWCAAFLGMATIFAEAVLAQTYKVRRPTGEITGGPAYYISEGLKCKPLAVFFSICIIIALGMVGNSVQSNSIAESFHLAFGVNQLLVGVILAVISGLVFFGGTARLASVTEKLVPIMAMCYIVGGLYILATHAGMIIPAFKMIIQGAFDPAAATGGIIGVTMKEAIRYGVARGLFANEAGMGSTPHAHAQAKVNHPAEQGFVAIMGVFITTFMIITMTALIILTTGSLDGVTSGSALTQKAFTTGLGSLGSPFVAVCIFFFAYSTIIGWYFFAEQNVKYLFGNKPLPIFRCIDVLHNPRFHAEARPRMAARGLLQRNHGHPEPHRRHRTCQGRQQRPQRFRREGPAEGVAKTIGKISYSENAPRLCGGRVFCTSFPQIRAVSAAVCARAGAASRSSPL